MEERVYLYPVWVRIWHMLNAILIILLILSGLALQYASHDFVIMGFRTAVSLHNVAGITLSISYVIFVFLNFYTGNYKYYLFALDKIWKDMGKQFKYYIFGIFKKGKAPFTIDEKRKFNPMQKFSYVVVMYFFMPIMIISGWGLLFPEINIPRIFGTSGLLLTDMFHIISGFILSIFMFIHIYFCTMGATYLESFKSMITGYHTKH